MWSLEIDRNLITIVLRLDVGLLMLPWYSGRVKVGDEVGERHLAGVIKLKARHFFFIVEQIKKINEVKNVKTIWTGTNIFLPFRF